MTFQKLNQWEQIEELRCAVCSLNKKVKALEIVEAASLPASVTDLTVFPGSVAPASRRGYFRDTVGGNDYWFAEGVWRRVAITTF